MDQEEETVTTEEDTVDEPFDPDEYRYYSAAVHKASSEIRQYVEKRFRKCIDKEKRKKMFSENPVPDTPAVHPPQADDDIVTFLGRSFPQKQDDRLRRIQATIVTSVSPLTKLWGELLEQNLTPSSGGLVPVDIILDTLQKSVAMIGNATNYVSQIKREVIISQIEIKKKGLVQILRKACKADLGEAEKELFGPTFRKTLKEKADAMVTFEKIADQVTHSGGHKSDQFF